MITGLLLKALANAESPRVIRPLIWALEARTGISTRTLMERKAVDLAWTDPQMPPPALNPNDPNSYQRNGFYRLAQYNGAASYSGKNVTAELALETAAVYACDKIISEDVGSLPLFIYERSQDGETIRKAFDHPLYEALHDMPNPEMSAGEFREALTARAGLGMDGFARIERTTRGRIVLWPLTGTVRIERNGSSQPIYIESSPGGRDTSYPPEQIFHLRGFTFDGSRGDNILQRARHVIGLTAAAQEYAGRYFSSDAAPTFFVTRQLGTTAWGPEQIQQWKDAWLALFRGQPHGTALLQDGMTVQRIDPDHRKLQMIESRLFQLREVARLYRMPLHKLGDLERATFSNIEHQAIEYVTNTLRPWLRRWEEAIHRCLLTPEERYWKGGQPRMYAEFSVEALLRGDFKAQTESWALLLDKGVLTINQVLKWLNLNPVPGGDGHYIQLNMQQVAGAANALLQSQQALMGAAADQAARKMIVELMEAKLLPAAQEVPQ